MILLPTDVPIPIEVDYYTPSLVEIFFEYMFPFSIMFAALALMVIAFTVVLVTITVRKSHGPMIGVSVVPFDSSAINGVFALQVMNYGRQPARNVKCSITSPVHDGLVYKYGAYDFLETPFFSDAGISSISPGQAVVYPFLRSLDSEGHPVEEFKSGSVTFDVKWRKSRLDFWQKDTVVVDFKDLMWIVESSFTTSQNDKKTLFEGVQHLKKISETLKSASRTI